MTDLSPTPTETDGSDSTQYSEVVASLIDRLPPSQLGPGTAADASLRQAMRAVLAKLSDRDLFLPGQSLVDTGAAACCRAGLWLGCDFLEESHSISQGIETASGSYWHGIMHRREPDPDNAKYWFRRVRRHPIFVPLAAAAAQFVNSRSANSPSESATPAAAAYLATQTVWDPLRFVDLCERMRGTDSYGEHLCRAIARIEWRLLYDNCHRQALGLE
jgi:hypothetical protein